jgi:hypothetical protein
MNPNDASGNPADWAFWAITVDGKGYISFAPVEGDYAEPQGAAQTMIRVATEGLSEVVEWVYLVPKKWKTRDIIKRLSTFGFKQDEKAHHLLKYCLEAGWLNADPDEEDIDEDELKAMMLDNERNPKNPDMLLGCICQKCRGVVPGKLIGWNTGLCPQCAGDDYEPTVYLDKLGMTLEEAKAWKPTEFKKGKF